LRHIHSHDRRPSRRLQGPRRSAKAGWGRYPVRETWRWIATRVSRHLLSAIVKKV